MLAVVAVALSGWIAAYGQPAETEVPGDNFSLEGALELFKKSASPEDFEKLLNSPDSKVNNLDLNGDGYIDYIRVLDRNEGNVHVFVMQALISENESQDVAVIELEKKANGKAVLQIIGDEDVYGVETIIEPTREVRTYAGTASTRTVVNVWAWPSVQYVYGPFYAGWVSPWGWYQRPIWWHRWRPVAYVHYYSIWRPYRPYYSVCHTYRVARAHELYRPYRRTSVVVVRRHGDQLSHYRASRRDHYRDGYSGNHGNRTYVRNDRSSIGTREYPHDRSADRNRRSEAARDETSHNRPAMKPSVSPDFKRNSTDRTRDYSADRRNLSLPAKTEARPSITRPSVERDRPNITPQVQRPSPAPRTIRPEIQRSTPMPQREVSPARRSPSVAPSRVSRPQSTRSSTTVSKSTSPRSHSDAAVNGGTRSRPERRGKY